MTGPWVLVVVTLFACAAHTHERARFADRAACELAAADAARPGAPRPYCREVTE